jgi:hypothetical protein
MTYKNGIVNYKNGIVITSTFVAFLMTALMASPAFAVNCETNPNAQQCKPLNCLSNPKLKGCQSSSHKACFHEIQDLSCWGKGKKCNIKFKNETGRGSGSGGGTGYEQVFDPVPIEVSARKSDGGRAGSRNLTIQSDASMTLNLDKKKDFELINIRGGFSGGSGVAKLECQDIKNILNGRGVCKVFMTGITFSTGNSIVVACNGGNVVSAAD